MEDISIHSEQYLKMTVEIEGIPEPKVQFYKDGKEVKQSERVKIVKEGEKHSLVMEKSSLVDTGTFIYQTCSKNDHRNLDFKYSGKL